MFGMPGEYIHFRCDRHQVEGFHVSGQANYRCEVKGCQWPATAYWFKGEQYQKLPTPQDVLSYGY